MTGPAALRADVRMVGRPGKTVASRVGVLRRAFFLLGLLAFGLICGVAVYVQQVLDARLLDLVDWPAYLVLWTLVGTAGALYGGGQRWRDVPDLDPRLTYSDFVGTMGPRMALVGVLGIWQDVILNRRVPVEMLDKLGVDVLLAAAGLTFWALVLLGRALALSFRSNPSRLPSLFSRVLTFVSFASVGVAGGLTFLRGFSGYSAGVVCASAVAVLGYWIALAERDMQPNDTQAERDEWDLSYPEQLEQGPAGGTGYPGQEGP